MSTSCVIFFIPKIIVDFRTDLHKMKIKTELCCKRYDFLAKETQNYRYQNYCLDDNIQIYSYGLLCEHVLSMRTVFETINNMWFLPWAKEKLSTRGRKRTLTDSEIKRNRNEVSSKWNKCRIYVGDQLDRCRWMERTQRSATRQISRWSGKDFAWLLLIGKPRMLPSFLNRFSYFMNLWWCLWSFSVDINQYM